MTRLSTSLRQRRDTTGGAVLAFAALAAAAWPFAIAVRARRRTAGGRNELKPPGVS